MKYKITVHTGKNPDYTTTVEAPHEGLAKTRAMFEYPHNLNGDLVTYTIEELFMDIYDYADSWSEEYVYEVLTNESPEYIRENFGYYAYDLLVRPVDLSHTGWMYLVACAMTVKGL